MQKNDPAGLAHAKKLIEENVKTQAPFLDLGNCGLRDLGELPELWECQHLEGLNMGGYYYKNGDYFYPNNTFIENKIGDTGAVDISINLTYLHELYLSSNRVGEKGARTIAEKLSKLVNLDLSLNSIGNKGVKTIFDNLSNLVSLNLHCNNLDQYECLSFGDKLKQLKSLNLSSNFIGNNIAIDIANKFPQITSLSLSANIIDIEGVIAISNNLTLLTNLDLSLNRISDSGVDIIASKLKQLTMLSISHNRITEVGALAIADKLNNLIYLNLSSNNIGDLGASKIANKLISLTSLNLSYADIGDNGAIAISEKLNQLTSIDLSSNSISEIGATAIAKNLSKLLHLNLSYNYSGDLGAQAIANNMSQLTSLYLSSNAIGNIGAIKIAEKLSKLESLDLAYNQIGDLGAIQIAKNLSNLNFLILTSNKINDLGAKSLVKNLKQIQCIWCDENNINTSNIFHELKLANSINLRSNPLKDIPLSFLNSLQNMKDWWQETEQETVPNLIVKLMVNGNGKVGKSSVLEALKKGKVQEDKDSTHGIVIDEWLYEEANQKVHFHIWDFGGQEIYHGTHKLFMQKDAVWIHVFDAKEEAAARDRKSVADRINSTELIQNHVLEYWIDEAGQNHPKIIVQTKKEMIGYEVKDIHLFNLAPSVNADFIQVDSLSGANINRLRSMVHEKATEINEYGMLMPGKWIMARNYFLSNIKSKDPKKLMSISEFEILCTENFKINKEFTNTLLYFLHQCGVLYYNEKYLKNTIVTDQKWALDAIYAPLDRKSKFYKDMRQLYYGRVKRGVIFDAFGAAYTKPHKALFLNLMKNIGLCYSLNTLSDNKQMDDWYVFPEFLPELSSPIVNSVWNRVTSYRTFRLNMPYLNYHKIQSYISAFGRKTEKEYVWRNGVLIEVGTSLIRIEADFERPGIEVKIESRLSNKAINEILTKDKYTHDKNIKWIEVIAGEEVPFSYVSISKGGNSMEANENVSLIDRMSFIPQKPPFKLVVSFASEDLRALKDLEECMEDYIYNGQLQLLYDQHAIDGASSFDVSIKKMFEDADGFLILASMKYQNRSMKKYIWKNEVPIIKKKHAEGCKTWVLAVAPVDLNSDLKDYASFKNCKEELPEEGHARTKFLLEFVQEVVEGKYLKEK